MEPEVLKSPRPNKPRRPENVDPEVLKSPRPNKPRRSENVEPEVLKSPRRKKPQRSEPEVSSSEVGDCEVIEYELGTFNIPRII